MLCFRSMDKTLNLIKLMHSHVTKPKEIVIFMNDEKDAMVSENCVHWFVRNAAQF